MVDVVVDLEPEYYRCDIGTQPESDTRVSVHLPDRFVGGRRNMENSPKLWIEPGTTGAQYPSQKWEKN